MAIPVLVVTPSPNFGENIRAALEQTESYRVLVVSNKVPAVVRAEEESCRLAILDLDLGDEWVEDIGQALRTVVPDIKLFLLAGNGIPPALDAIRPWTLLRKPFHLPSVLISLARPGTPPEAAKIVTRPHGDLPWLKDVNTAAQHLTRLTLESSSQAALITRDNEVWAYAGELPQAAAQELAGVMSRNWDSETDGDLLRFARLETTRAEHILYATRLGAGMLLGLLFDAETPFGTIRSQAGKLGSLLERDDTAPPPEPVSVAPLTWTPAPPPPPAAEPEMHEEDEEDIPFPEIQNILHDVPPPEPEPLEPEPPVEAPLPLPDLDATRRTPIPRDLNVSWAAPVAESPPAPAENLGETAAAAPVARQPEAPPSQSAEPAASAAPPAQAGVEHTLPHSLVGFAGPGTSAPRVNFEPIYAGVYHLTYACLLLPRFTNHYLTGEVADKLSEWMPIICIAFGWRLEYVAVRPEYLQWVSNVPPATSPGYVMRIMRTQTSEKLFGAFPALKQDNPSGDFWAPGYLIMGGTQPHPSQLVKDYIKQVRQRQGHDKPGR